MILTIFRHANPDVLDTIVASSTVPFAFIGESGHRAGTVLRVWRDKNTIKADVECVPEDIQRMPHLRGK